MSLLTLPRWFRRITKRNYAKEEKGKEYFRQNDSGKKAQGLLSGHGVQFLDCGREDTGVEVEIDTDYISSNLRCHWL